jgi:hypothetical protein
MSFRWFRQYEKQFLWAAVIVSIGVFVVFSGIGNLRQLIGGHADHELAGTFVVQSTGETCEVSIDDFVRTRNLLNKLLYGQRREALSEDEVWAHLMLLADADGAGIDVSKADVVNAISSMAGGATVTKEDFRREWSSRQFASGREMEGLIRDLLKTARWQEWSSQSARIVDLDDVYVRWKADNERRDLEALVFPDRKPEDIPDPSRETVQAFYDEQTEGYRAERYKEDARFDIVYARLPLDADQTVVPDTMLAELPEPDPATVEQRFAAFKAERWPDLEQPDDAIRATLARELKLVDHVQRVLGTFEARADKTADTFKETMAAGGLTVVDSEGALGTDELKALPLDDEWLPVWLGTKGVGETHLGRPMGAPKSAYAVYIQDIVPSHPLSFDEAYDKVVKDWKERQRDQAARDFRERLREETRKLPEVAEIIAPLQAAAEKAADEAVAAATDLDEAGRAALRKEMLDEAERQQILPRLAEHEHKVWSTIPRPDGVESIALTGVSRSYARHPDDAAEAADSIERFLKTNGRLFTLGVDAISDTLRFASGSKTAIVHITGRAFPEQAEMLADAAGLEASRQTLAQQRESEARNEFMPDRMKTTHQLRVPTRQEQQQ